MNHNISSRDQSILSCLVNIPPKILQLHGTENVTEFVLHELCDFNCFNFSKAAYFVDNPDFNCCKGVAGCSMNERYMQGEEAWKRPQDFSQHMESSDFNKKVRQMHDTAISHKVEDVVHHFSDQLGIKNPKYYQWELKNNNHGILIFEHNPENYEQIKYHLPNGASLLGFCPVF